jgi:hypothetical protein
MKKILILLLPIVLVVGCDNSSDVDDVGNQPLENRIARVFEYVPAPGQFINKMPAASTEDTHETMRAKAEEDLKEGKMVNLGTFGGYIVIGFEQTIKNKEGADFVILGNAFANSAKPGVILVSYDANGDGLPNDDWYEIAGSEYHKNTTIKDYEITYYRPESEPEGIEEQNYIRWTDNQGRSGYLSKNRFHRQAYYPMWLGDQYTLRGTLAKSNTYDQSGTGMNWITSAFDWGYADNWSNSDERAQIDIDWAVDKDGNPVKLSGIDFIKVHTGVSEQAGWLGQLATVISGFIDLNF